MQDAKQWVESVSQNWRIFGSFALGAMEDISIPWIGVYKDYTGPTPLGCFEILKAHALPEGFGDLLLDWVPLSEEPEDPIARFHTESGSWSLTMHYEEGAEPRATIRVLVDDNLQGYWQDDSDWSWETCLIQPGSFDEIEAAIAAMALYQVL